LAGTQAASLALQDMLRAGQVGLHGANRSDWPLETAGHWGDPSAGPAAQQAVTVQDWRSLPRQITLYLVPSAAIEFAVAV
jgi:hypothetical protein